MIELGSRRFWSLSSEEDARVIAREVLALEPGAGVVVLVEHRRERRGLALPVIGAAPIPEHIHRIDRLALKAVEKERGCRMVLASVRPDGTDVLEEDDVTTWRQLRQRHARTRVPLLDWLVFSGRSTVFSLASLVGPPARW